MGFTHRERPDRPREDTMGAGAWEHVETFGSRRNLSLARPQSLSFLFAFALLSAPDLTPR